MYAKSHLYKLPKTLCGLSSTLNSSFSTVLDCKRVSKQILSLIKRDTDELKVKPKITIILALDKDKKPDPASEIYVNKKINSMPKVGIEAQLIKVDPSITKSEMMKIIDKINESPEVTSAIVQLPFPKDFSFNIHELIHHIKPEKNVDGFCSVNNMEPNLSHPHTLKPPTALGITALLSYYGMKTEGQKIAVIGKGPLVGQPLTKMLQVAPFFATATSCDIFTSDRKSVTKNSSMVISAAGVAELIKGDDIQDSSVLIDVGINRKGRKRSRSRSRSRSKSPIDNKPEMNTHFKNKRKIYGDMSQCARDKASFHTPVPGGVGLLTVATLAWNVMHSYRLQNGMPILDLNNQLKDMNKRNQFMMKQQNRGTQLRILLISSAYNGLTQKIDRVLSDEGHVISFQTASSPEAMRASVADFKPDLIVCPTLMKPIPQDIYKKVKCLIVHPGIKGDRGPSAIDWAILGKKKQWGVTVLEADQEMDAGDIWATGNFPILEGMSKVQIYNQCVFKMAEELILEAIEKFKEKGFKAQKLNYNDPSVKGNLHKTIKINDPERKVNWFQQKTADIIVKALAADTQPGLRIDLTVGDKILKKFSYGYVEQKEIQPSANVKPGQIFMRKLQAVCVKTVDGAVWIKQLRDIKSEANQNPFKVPATMSIGKELAEKITEVSSHSLQLPDENTFEEISFQTRGNVGILNFDFYNGAMTTAQCKRMAEAVKDISEMKDIKVLVLGGSKKSWSNGINLNTIEFAQDPAHQAWQNIQAINQIVKNLFKMRNKITISAMQANAGAGGVYLGLACDYTFAKDGIVMNPHYRRMGLYGSELHTVTAQLKYGNAIISYLKEAAKPMITKEAIELGLLDNNLLQKGQFFENVLKFSQGICQNDLDMKLAKKNARMSQYLQYKSIEDYEKEELAEMHKDMFEDRNGFNVRRKAFVRKVTCAEVTGSIQIEQMKKNITKVTEKIITSTDSVIA